MCLNGLGLGHTNGLSLLSLSRSTTKQNDKVAEIDSSTTVNHDHL